MKKYFVTGLIILLPAALTIAIVAFIFNLLTEPFLGIVKSIFAYYSFLQGGFLFLSADQLQTYLSKIIIIIFLFFSTVLLGLIAHIFFFYYLIRLWDYLIHRIPIINTIYKTCQDMINTLFLSDAKAFQQVVLVPFPNKDANSIGFVTCATLPPIGGLQDLDRVVVFVPTTPNPTSGFLTLYKKEDLVYLDMKVEDAFKFIISCGVIMVPFSKVTEAQIEVVDALSNQDSSL